MKENKKVKKILKPVAFGVLSAAMLLSTACGESKRVYDPSTRVATDEGETVVNLSEKEYAFYNNYIEFYDGDGDIYDIGDPYVFRFNGKYYLYSSLNGSKKTSGKIPCWVSDNLVDWEWAGWAYDPNSTSTSSETYIAFAPEVIYYKGWFYMCESRRGQGHYFFRSASPSGPFELISDNLGMGIDGSFYLADNGQLYFVSANNVTSTRICWYPIDFVETDGKVEVKVDNSLVNVVDTAYLNAWTEGPGFISRNGYNYITYTGNHVDSASYKVGYSYTTDANVLQGLVAPDYNITLASSGMDNQALAGYGAKDTKVRVSNFRGTGHSSNTIGPNMDSVYTAFHIANRVNYDNVMGDSTRKYALTQYFTNDSYLLTNGLGNYQKTKPEMPDYSATGSQLTASDGFTLSEAASEKIFTAEVCLTLENGKGTAVFGYDNGNYYSVEIDGTKLTYNKVSGGSTTKLAEATVSVSTNESAIHTVKIANGYKKADISYDGMKLLTTEKVASAGKVGVKSSNLSSVHITNDAFGTSDFDAVKDLTGSWAAYAYMKGENVGYSLNKASVKSNGVRQGEVEKTKQGNGYTAVELGRDDWVKYTVNAPEAGSYSLSFLLGKASAGCVFEVIVDNETITKMEIPEDAYFGESGYINYNVGQFAVDEAGLHTLKIRVFDGTLDFVNVSTEKGGELLGEVNDALTDKNSSVFQQKLGIKTAFNTAGLTTNSDDERTLLITGNKGVSDYEFSMDVKISSGSSTGILFRMNNYSYSYYTTTKQGDDFQGYYLILNKNYISLNKRYYYQTLEKVATEKPDSYDTFKNGDFVTVTVKCDGAKITVSLNGTEYISYKDDTPFVSGYIAIFGESGTSAIYKNYSYREI